MVACLKILQYKDSDRLPTKTRAGADIQLDGNCCHTSLNVKSFIVNVVRVGPDKTSCQTVTVVLENTPVILITRLENEFSFASITTLLQNIFLALISHHYYQVRGAIAVFIYTNYDSGKAPEAAFKKLRIKTSIYLACIFPNFMIDSFFLFNLETFNL
ncbi:hypothetical protein BDF20DRAFT_984880 [Mycotypha africana]|uniref:uncharacterized protein n=1 Tax=Mycotypha africana TaxID=64632 RepID=UPI0023004223|nr:uncharacterized protein BDF20DRAFT_984880 [Mycotypha africana]KAI8987402.1 hypothetical protein BDF20DRAFT_984880 [Mycotypha africana]